MTRVRTASGEWRVLEVVPTNCLADPAVAGIVLNARDVTERTNLTRVLRTLSAGNRALVSAADEAALLADVCRAIVDVGGFPLAWVGYAEHDEVSAVRPVACAGQCGYLEGIQVSWADGDHGHGPTGTAIRTGAVEVVGDLGALSGFAPWKATAADFGLRSSCALPLRLGGEVIGALNIYAPWPEAFGASELELLAELADDLAYGIGRQRDSVLLQESEQRFGALAADAPIGIFEVRPGGAVSYANPRAAEITGRAAEALLGRDWAGAVHPDDVAEMVALVDGAGSAGKAATKLRLVRPSGEVRHVRMLRTGRGQGRDSGYIVVLEDITDEVNAQEALAHQASHDALTGLPNRAMFLDRLGEDLARQRRGGSHVAVLFLGLDQFKVVNDSLGHAAGDAVLKEVGDRFFHGVRAGETVARFSGDVFIFIIRDVLEVDEAVAAARRLLALLGPPVRVAGQDLGVTGSIGIVVPSDAADAATVLRDAGTAMYRAKAQGRNCWALFDEGLHARSVKRLALETELRRALERHEFEVYYQPVVEPASGRPVSVEALARWHHPERGLVPPLEFIPVAEDSGLIKPIGRWVFEQAVCQLAAWDGQDDGPALEGMAINLSARQLDDPDTPDMVRALLQRNGTAPGRVCVEVTESAMMADNASAAGPWRPSGSSGSGWRSTISAPGTPHWPASTPYRSRRSR